MPPEPYDPLAKLPDPDKRYQVFGFLRGEAVFIQVLDAEAKTGFVLDVQAALEVARDILDETVRMADVLVERQLLKESGILEPEPDDRDDPRWQVDMWRRSEN